jgi:exonuclease III
MKAGLLSIIHWNVNGYHERKRGTIVKYINTYDITILTETWWTPNEAREFVVPGYEHNFQCRNAKKEHGGTSFFVRNSLKPYTQRLANPSKLDCAWLRIDKQACATGRSILVGGIYMPPEGSPQYRKTNITQAYYQLATDIATLKEVDDDLFIGGDFNAHLGMLTDIPDHSDVQLLMHALPQEVLPTIMNMADIPPLRKNSGSTSANSFGKDLVEHLCHGAGLIVANGRVHGDDNGACTFPTANDPKRKRKQRKEVLDLYLMSPSLYRFTECMHVHTNEKLGQGRKPDSDHWPVSIEIRILCPVPNRIRTQRGNKKIKFVVDKWEKYALEMSNVDKREALEGMSRSIEDGKIDSNQFLSALFSMIQDCTKHAFKEIKTKYSKNDTWWTPECQLSKDLADDALTALKTAELAGASVDELSRLTACMRRTRNKFTKVKEQAKGAAMVKQKEAVAQTFFEHPPLFWKYFKKQQATGEEGPTLSQLTEHFQSLLGGSVSESKLTNQQLQHAVSEMRQAHAAHYLPNQTTDNSDAVIESLLKQRRADASDAHLDDAWTFTEVDIREVFDKIQNCKAVGEDGLPGECLKYARVVQNRGTEQQYVEHLLVKPCMALFNHIARTGDYPEGWKTALLTALYKGKGDQMEPGNYRGIAVTSIFSRCYAAAFQNKVSAHLEKKGLRMSGQSGFRSGKGTHDNLYVIKLLQAMYCDTKKSKGAAYVCFVDFVKAFDMVKRELIWERLKILGLQGKVISALQCMYKEVRMQVKVKGQTGKVFESLLGVKQGDPLSPVLFGALIEVLPEFLTLYKKRAFEAGNGPPWDQDSVDLDGYMLCYMLFADDLTLISTSLTSLQQMLRILEAFCDIMHFEVNISKTEFIVFCTEKEWRSVGTHVEENPLRFRTQVIRRVTEVKYLGLKFLERGGCACAYEALCLAANRARFAVQSRITKMGNLTPELQIRLFNALVLPVLTYGCQVWGPELFKLNRNSTSLPSGALEKVYTDFLRFATGVGKSAPNWCLWRDCCVDPVRFHVVKRVLRFWNDIKSKPNTMVWHAWRADLQLMLDGSRQSWSYKVCCLLTKVGVLPDTYQPTNMVTACGPNVKGAMEYLMTLPIDAGAIAQALKLSWHSCVTEQITGSPRTAEHSKYDTYETWMALDDPPQGYHKHLSVSCSQEVFKTYMRFRCCAWHNLAVHHGRMKKPYVARGDRLCPRCVQPCIEDEMHVLLECPYYNDLRAENAMLFQSSHAEGMKCFFQHEDTRRAMNYVHDLAQLRATIKW